MATEYLFQMPVRSMTLTTRADTVMCLVWFQMPVRSMTLTTHTRQPHRVNICSFQGH